MGAVRHRRCDGVGRPADGPAMSASSPALPRSTQAVIVTAHDGQVVLCPQPVLDAHVGGVLADATAGAAEVGGRVVCFDLTGVEEFTEAGIDTIRTCRQIAHARGMQLIFRADSAIARQILLTMWARD